MDPVEKAASVLRHDGLVIYPTDTIYGLGADALSEEAITRVYEAKRRPFSAPISVAVCSCDMIHGIARVNDYAARFIDRFLPGPVTVVLPARNSLPGILTGGTGLVGIRIPRHPVALRLIELLDSPITATSANTSGARDPVVPGDCNVPHDFMIDGGRLPGTASTVIDLVSLTIIRPGAELEQVLAYISARE